MKGEEFNEEEGPMIASKLLKTLRLTAVTFVAALLVADVAWAQQKFPLSRTGEGVKSRYVQQQLSILAISPGTRFGSRRASARIQEQGTPLTA